MTTPSPDSPERKLWYRSAAGGDWNQALPVGNGRLGAMIFGNVLEEQIELNEDTLWSGGPRDRINPDALTHLAEIRRLTLAGDLEQANALAVDAFSGVPDIMRQYAPLGRLLISFHHPSAKIHLSDQDLGMVPSLQKPSAVEGIENYRRELDLRTAIMSVEYTTGGARFVREHLTSAPDQVFAVRLTSDTAGKVQFRLRFERGPHDNYAARYIDTAMKIDETTLLLRGRESGEGAVSFAVALGISTRGGRAYLLGETLVVEDADEALVLLAAGTTFRDADPAQLSITRLRAAQAKGWETLCTDHVADYQGWFDRVALELDSPDEFADLPTDERLNHQKERVADPGLAALYFDFGRYLLISSSRPGSLPPNLQGIWNRDFFPAWGGKYTININTEMNYWPALASDLAELQEPLFDLLERLRVTGAEVARRMYNCRGFVVHHNTDLWADACPVDRNLSASFWLLGGAWLSLQLWENFAFHRDVAFLRRAYPILKDASLFFLDFLQKDSHGRLVLIPSSSPENVFRLPSGKPGTLCAGTSMDGQIVDALFFATADAAEHLGVDADLVRELQAARAQLPKPAIGKHGQLLEWLEDYEETDLQHRHISHLFALHPWSAITARHTPELAQACRVSLERRGDASTGWSLAWKMGCWARLGDGARAERLLQMLLTPADAKEISYHGGGGSYTSLLCCHPPFQIDGNFGGTAAIVEMLLQSRALGISGGGDSFEIQLLPALPPSWANGAVRGLRARGSIRATFSWTGGRLEKAELQAHSATRIVLLYSKLTRDLSFAKGEIKHFDAELNEVHSSKPSAEAHP